MTWIILLVILVSLILAFVIPVEIYKRTERYFYLLDKMGDTLKENNKDKYYKRVEFVVNHFPDVQYKNLEVKPSKYGFGWFIKCKLREYDESDDEYRYVPYCLPNNVNVRNSIRYRPTRYVKTKEMAIILKQEILDGLLHDIMNSQEAIELREKLLYEI